jgi:hypothetical protein
MGFALGHKFSVGNQNWKKRVEHQAGNRLISRALHAMLNETDLSDAQKRTKADRIADTAYRLAIKGDVAAMRFITERTEGSTPQKIDLGIQQNITAINVHMGISEAFKNGPREVLPGNGAQQVGRAPAATFD